MSPNNGTGLRGVIDSFTHSVDLISKIWWLIFTALDLGQVELAQAANLDNYLKER